MGKYNKPSICELNMIRTAICFCFILDSCSDNNLGFHLIWGYGGLEPNMISGVGLWGYMMFLKR